MTLDLPDVSHRTVAEAFVKALAFQLVDVAEVIDWVDRVIVAEPRPAFAFLEASGSGGNLDVLIGALNAVPGSADAGARRVVVFRIMHHAMERDANSIAAVVRLLSCMVRDDDVPDRKGEGRMRYLEDAYDLCVSGVQGTMDEVRRDVMQFLREYGEVPSRGAGGAGADEARTPPVDGDDPATPAARRSGDRSSAEGPTNGAFHSSAVARPDGVPRFLLGCGLAIAAGVMSERSLAQQRDSMNLELYSAFALLAFLLGATQRSQAWIVGMLLVPSYWLSAISRWPTTSTVGVGHGFSILAAIPHAVVAAWGMRTARRLRRE